VVAAPEEFAPLSEPPTRFEIRGDHKWPRYTVAVDLAPMNNAGTDKDYSKADIGWCITAIRRKFGINETAAMLLEVSEHARHPSNGKRYAERTAARAADYVQQRTRPRLPIKQDHG